MPAWAAVPLPAPAAIADPAGPAALIAPGEADVLEDPASSHQLAARQGNCISSREVEGPSSAALVRVHIAANQESAAWVRLSDLGIYARGIQARAYHTTTRGIEVQYRLSVEDDTINYEFDMYAPSQSQVGTGDPPLRAFTQFAAYTHRFTRTGSGTVILCRLSTGSEQQLMVGVRRG